MASHSEQVLESISSTGLHLILLPTEACNFRCTYCYETFEYKRMEPAVVRGVKNLILRRAPFLQRLSIGWFGGEPLLAQDIIEEVSGCVREVTASNMKLQTAADITTNAYLMTPAVFDRLLDQGISRFQISFDGPRELHDRKRMLAGGRGTFDTIWGNLMATRQSSRSFEILVRIHADRENAGALEHLLDQFAGEFGHDPRYRMFLRPLGRFGGPNDKTLKVLGATEAEALVAALRAKATVKGLLPYQVEADAMCYAARADSLVIRANGRINKCTLALEHPANQVGMIHEDGRLDIRSGSLAPWIRGVFSGRKEELECPMIGLAEVGGAGSRSLDLPLAPVKVSAHGGNARYVWGTSGGLR